MKSNSKTQDLFVCHAELCKVFSHPKRLELINILRDQEMSVGELAKKLKISIGNLSQHLTMMKGRKVVLVRKVGNVVYYRLSNPKMLKAFDLIREILYEQIRSANRLIGAGTSKATGGIK
ncbi:MAG: winged helix-turn-helix transcriptional regulator [Candidatus Omnitrophica bacterium]|nr:winged helix-turn-helix transcriptional regulator [Candidatus Omnitrophota bacterium]